MSDTDSEAKRPLADLEDGPLAELEASSATLGDLEAGEAGE